MVINQPSNKHYNTTKKSYSFFSSCFNKLGTTRYMKMKPHVQLKNCILKLYVWWKGSAKRRWTNIYFICCDPVNCIKNASCHGSCPWLFDCYTRKDEKSTKNRVVQKYLKFNILSMAFCLKKPYSLMNPLIRSLGA